MLNIKKIGVPIFAIVFLLTIMTKMDILAMPCHFTEYFGCEMGNYVIVEYLKQDTDDCPFNAQIEQMGGMGVQPGHTMFFGWWLWCVLEVENGYAKLLFNSVITGRPFHNIWEAATWETSSAREWLNGYFFNRFSTPEQSRIRETYVVNDDNMIFGTPGGNNTTDRIFLLSISEVLYHFVDSGRAAQSDWVDDRYNSVRGIGVNWFLRSPGITNYSASVVHSFGVMTQLGFSNGISDHTPHEGIRPALWLRLDEYQNGSQICDRDCDCPECIGFHPPLTGVPGITVPLAAMAGLAAVSVFFWGLLLAQLQCKKPRRAC